MTCFTIEISLFFLLRTKVSPPNVFSLAFCANFALSAGEFSECLLISAKDFFLQRSAVILHSVQSSFNAAYVSELIAVAFNDSQGVSRLNFSANQLVDFKKMIISISLTGQSGKSDDFDKLLLKGSVDACHVAKGTFGNFIIRLFASNLHKFSNFKFVCPQAKGFYFVNGLPMVEDSFLPSSIRIVSGPAEVCVIVKAKLQNVKPLVHALTLKLILSRG